MEVIEWNHMHRCRVSVKYIHMSDTKDTFKMKCQCYIVLIPLGKVSYMYWTTVLQKSEGWKPYLRWRREHMNFKITINFNLWYTPRKKTNLAKTTTIKHYTFIIIKVSTKIWTSKAKPIKFQIRIWSQKLKASQLTRGCSGLSRIPHEVKKKVKITNVFV